MKYYNYVKSNIRLNKLFLQYLIDGSKVGIIKSITDGVVVVIEGLSKIKAGEMLFYIINKIKKILIFHVILVLVFFLFLLLYKNYTFNI